MPGDHSDHSNQPEQSKLNKVADESCDRRTALSYGSSIAMAGGLVSGYGTFFAMASP